MMPVVAPYLTTSKVLTIAASGAVGSAVSALAAPAFDWNTAIAAGIGAVVSSTVSGLIIVTFGAYLNRRLNAITTHVDGKMEELIRAKESVALRTGWDAGTQHADDRAQDAAEKTAVAATALGDARERAATAEGRHIGAIEEQSRKADEDATIAAAAKSGVHPPDKPEK